MKIKLFGKELLTIESSQKKSWSLDEAIKWLQSQHDNRDGAVTQKNAFKRHVWVYACINAIAQNIARVPFKIYQVDSKGIIVDEVTSGPAYELFRYVSPHLNRFQLWEGSEVYKQMRGQSFWYLNIPGTYPVEINFLDPDSMQPVIMDGIMVGWKYRNNTINENFTPEEIIQFKFFNPWNEYLGLSPLKASMNSIEIDDLARRFDKAILKNQSSPGGVLEVEESLTDTQYKRIKKQWEARHKGADKAGKVAVIEGGAKYKELKLTPEEIKYIEQRKMSREEIAAIYKVPPIEIGIFEYANYANAKEQAKMFWSKKLIPEMMYVQDVLKTQLFDVYFKGQVGLFDLSQVEEIQTDMEAKIKWARDLWTMGMPLYDINQKLDLGFDLEQYEWTKVGYLPFNLIVAGEDAPAEEEKKRLPGKAGPEAVQKFLETAEKYQKRVNNTNRKYIIWKGLIQSMAPIIGKYRKKLSSFIFQLRQEILENFFNMDPEELKSIEVKRDKKPLFNKAENIKKLEETSMPYITDGMEKGGKLAWKEVGIETEFTLGSPAAVDQLNKRRGYLKEIINTVDDQVEKTITAGIKKGLGVEEIAKNIKGKMDALGHRAKTIARTEIMSAANEGRVIGFSEGNIEKHQWLSSFDQKVREEHLISETVPVGEEFSNGLKYPGDRTGSGSDPANIINCRCTTIAVIEEAD